MSVHLGMDSHQELRRCRDDMARRAERTVRRDPVLNCVSAPYHQFRLGTHQTRPACDTADRNWVLEFISSLPQVLTHVVPGYDIRGTSSPIDAEAVSAPEKHCL